MELLLGLYYLSAARPQLCSQTRSLQGTSSAWLNPSACSVAKCDHALQTSLHGFKLPVSNERSIRLQKKPGTELQILFMDSTNEQTANNLHSLGTCAPHGCCTMDKCHTRLSCLMRFPASGSCQF